MTSPVQSFLPVEPRGLRGYARFWAAFLAVLVTDQASKAWVRGHIEPGTYFSPPPIPVIDGFFYFVNVSNTGAAWSMFEHYTRWLALLGALALVAVYFFRRQLELRRPLLQYTFGIMCGGILGNLIDRGLHGSVVDFLDFHLPGYRYPAFNVADSGITVGVLIYLLYSFRDWRPGHRAAAPPTASAPTPAAENASTTSPGSTLQSAGS
jgi:signal peptidase II